LAKLLPTAASSQETVDDSQAALEIAARSSYVPALAPSWRSIRIFRRSAPERARPDALELPIWMRF
jgi:hypothetical protein